MLDESAVPLEAVAEDGQVIKADDPQAIAESVTPIFEDDNRKTRYLSYRACGFNRNEALKIVGVSLRTLYRWREKDPVFAEFDARHSEARTELANRYIELEFRRNMRLVLELDYEVLYKAANKDELTAQDQKWLAKVRQHYTPQQLEAMERILGETEGGDGFGGFANFTEFVLNIQREGQQITIAGRRAE